ncbi:MAG: hypothetical protein AB2L14_05395 [Candidatus Xenobiia bacterium LiM19]
MSSSIIPPSIPDRMTSGSLQGARDSLSPSSAAPHKDCEAKNIVDGIQDLDTAPEVMERLYTLSEMGTTILQAGSDIIAESGLKGNLGIAAGAGTAVSGVFFAVKGAKDLKDAIAKKDAMAGLGATGELALAGNAAISSAQMLTTLTSASKYIDPSVASLINSPIAGVAAKSLGMIFAASELVQGGRLLHDGYAHKNKEKMILGALSVGVGASAAVLFTVGGVTSAVVLGALSIAELITFGAEKVSDNLRKRHHEQELKLKSAAAEQVLQQPSPVEQGDESLLDARSLTSGHHTP